MCKLQCFEICTLLKKIMVGVKIDENLNRAQKMTKSNRDFF